jgi:hypothetical protein
MYQLVKYFKNKDKIKHHFENHSNIVPTGTLVDNKEYNKDNRIMTQKINSKTNLKCGCGI